MRWLASEKRSSGKSRGWSWRISCVYGDLMGSVALADWAGWFGGAGTGKLIRFFCGLFADMRGVPLISAAFAPPLFGFAHAG